MLCVYLPQLPLEALRPCWSEPGPFAVIAQGAVMCMSESAADCGVRLGMRAGGAAAVAPAATLLERSLEKEELALDAVATALMQFTPEVVAGRGFALLMDVGASLTLFGGPAMLCRRIMRTLRALGFTGRVGAAPTAEGAWLLARRPRNRGLAHRRRTLRMTTLVRQLDEFPCSLLPETQPFGDWLNDIGARNLAALRRLPRAGLLRRTGAELLSVLDRAYGEAPELFDWIKPPLTFSARLETFDRVEHADDLLDGATRLLLQLVGWLASLQRAIRIFTFYLEHERGRSAVPPTALEVALAEPAWKETHLIRLLKERLAKLELPAPVIALRLEAVKIEAMAPPNASLFPDPCGSAEEFHRLLELLIARLGCDNVLVPGVIDDFRPEVCNTWVPAGGGERRGQLQEVFDGRPFFLLPKPIALLMRDERPFYGSALRIVQGPERIEAGWWNDQTAARDYYVAQGSDDTRYWIYLERTQDARWYLHGLYG